MNLADHYLSLRQQAKEIEEQLSACKDECRGALERGDELVSSDGSQVICLQASERFVYDDEGAQASLPWRSLKLIVSVDHKRVEAALKVGLLRLDQIEPLRKRTVSESVVVKRAAAA